MQLKHGRLTAEAIANMMAIDESNRIAATISPDTFAQRKVDFLREYLSSLQFDPYTTPEIDEVMKILQDSDHTTTQVIREGRSV